MKTIGAFFIAIMLLLSGCSEAIKELLPSMTAKIDGQEWVTTVRATVQQDDKFIITGTALSGETLVITILGTSEGQYEVSIINPGCFAIYKEEANTAIEGAAAVEGFVNLTDVNTSSKTISGTFEFTIVKDLNKMNVTNGEFSRIKYTVSES